MYNYIKKLFFKLIDKIFGIIPYRKLKLYIVEDVLYYAKMIEINLGNDGYKDIKLFLDGESTIESLKNESPDCVILDHILSKDGLDGSDVLSFINSNNPNTKVVILSGQESLEVATNIIKQGAYDYIIKNDMSTFNLKNTLTRLEESINEKEKSEWRDKRIKLLYVLLLALLWILAAVILL